MPRPHQEVAPFDFVVTDIMYVIERFPDPGWQMKRLLSHTHHTMALAISGQAHYMIEGVQHTIREGDVLFFRKGLLRSAFSDATSPWSFYYVTFKTESTAEADGTELLEAIMKSSNRYEYQALFQELSAAWTGKRPNYLIRCRSLIMELMSKLIYDQHYARQASRHALAIEAAMNLMLANYSLTYTVEQLAQISGLSYSHFRLLFKQISGQTVVEYQNRIKISKAKDYLLSGECNVSEAAEKVGFQNIYYFSRLFKKMCGVSPSTFAKNK